MTPEPVTLPTEAEVLAFLPPETVKKNLRISHVKEDDLLTLWIVAAQAALDGIDGWVRRPILEATYAQPFLRFSQDLELKVPGVTEIVEIGYEGGAEPVDSANYALLQWRGGNYVRFPSTFVYPDLTTSETPRGVTVQFKAKCPRAEPALRQAMLLLASHCYRNREETFADPRQSLSNHRIEMGIKFFLGRFQAPLRYEGG